MGGLTSGVKMDFTHASAKAIRRLTWVYMHNVGLSMPQQKHYLCKKEFHPTIIGLTLLHTIQNGFHPCLSKSYREAYLGLHAQWRTIDAPSKTIGGLTYFTGVKFISPMPQQKL